MKTPKTIRHVIAQQLFDETAPKTKLNIPIERWQRDTVVYFTTLADGVISRIGLDRNYVVREDRPLPHYSWLETYVNGQYSPGPGLTALENFEDVLAGWSTENNKGFTDLEEQRKSALDR